MQLRRQLAAARPEAYLNDLARSLSNLGVSLGDLGRREEASSVARESVGLFEALVERHGSRFAAALRKAQKALEHLDPEEE